MKKRLVAVLMAMAMCFALVGCGGTDDSTEAPVEEEVVTEEQTTDEGTEAPAEEETDAPVEEGTGDAPAEETPAE